MPRAEEKKIKKDTSVDFMRAYEIYAMRWAIEVFFYEKYIIMQSYVVGIHSNKQIV